MSFVAAILRASRNRVVTTRSDGKTEKCSGSFTFTALSMMTTDVAMATTKQVSRMNSGRGRMSMETMSNIPIPMRRSVCLNSFCKVVIMPVFFWAQSWPIGVIGKNTGRIRLG